MQDNEIIKALEEHYRQVDAGYSTHLEYGGKGDEHEEKYIYMLRDTLDLINRLKSENYDLKRDTIPKLQNSLERANKYGIETDKENERLKAEIERLTANLEKWLDRCNEKCIEIVKLNHAVQAAKSEAHKEFVTKAEGKATNLKDCTGTEVVFTVDDLYDLLEEMG